MIPIISGLGNCPSIEFFNAREIPKPEISGITQVRTRRSHALSTEHSHNDWRHTTALPGPAMSLTLFPICNPPSLRTSILGKSSSQEIIRTQNVKVNSKRELPNSQNGELSEFTFQFAFSFLVHIYQFTFCQSSRSTPEFTFVLMGAYAINRIT